MESIDPEVLAGRGDRFESMLAIGGMPPQIAPEVRRASIDCQRNEADLARIAADLETSVDDQGSLKVGYFEFLPPSLLD